MNQKTKAYFALGTVSFVWGTTYLAMRTGAAHMPGLMLAAIRNTAAGILVVGWFLLKGHRIPDLKTLLRLALIGLVMLGAGNGLMNWGEQTVPSGLASILAALNPLCIAFFSLLLIKGVRLNFIVIAGLISGLAGIFVIFYPMLLQPMQTGFAFGVVLILFAVLGWSSGSVFAARQNFSLNILYACGWEFLFGGIALIVASLATGETIPLGSVDTQSWLSIGYLVIAGSLIGYMAYQYALKHLPTTQVAIYGYINPIVALFLGWLLLGEKLNWRILIGVVITLTGVFLVQRSFRNVKSRLRKQHPGKGKWYLPGKYRLTGK